VNLFAEYGGRFPFSILSRKIKRADHFVISSFYFGARVEQVDEHPASSCATFIFEIEEYPEAKAPSTDDLKTLYADLRSFRAVAQRIGASEAFVRQTYQNKKYKNSKC
jgi:hypothetical protein